METRLLYNAAAPVPWALLGYLSLNSMKAAVFSLERCIFKGLNNNGMATPDVCEIPRWQQLKRLLNNLAPAEFKTALAETPDVVLIDVRTQPEYDAGHIPGAINIDYLSYDFWDRMEQLDPERTYFIYCRTSRRSVRTCTLMRNGGFKHIYHLDGGWNLWSEVFGGQEMERSSD